MPAPVAIPTPVEVPATVRPEVVVPPPAATPAPPAVFEALPPAILAPVPAALLAAGATDTEAETPPVVAFPTIALPAVADDSLWTASRSSLFMPTDDAPSLSPYASVWAGPTTTPAMPSAAKAAGGGHRAARSEDDAINDWQRIAPPRRRSGFLRTLVTMIVALAILAGGGYAGYRYLHHSSSAAALDTGVPRVVSVPSVVGTYKRVSNAAFESSVLTSMSSDATTTPAEKALIKTGVVGFYPTSPDDKSFAVFTAFNFAGAPSALAEAKQLGAKNFLDTVILAGSARIWDGDAGPLGGVMRCGVSAAAGAPETLCAWIDGSTVGLLDFENMVPLSSQAAHDTLAFRTAAEH